MHYSLTQLPLITDSECLIIGVFDDRILPHFATTLDQQHQGLLTRIISTLAEKGDIAWQTDFESHQLLFIHCGTAKTFTAEQLAKRMSDITSCLMTHHISSATLCLPAISNHSADWQVQQMLLHIEMQRYQLLDFKSKPKKSNQLETIQFFLPGSTPCTIDTAQAIANGVCLTQTLANLPANICTPSYIADAAIKLAQQHSTITTKVLDRAEIQSLGMGSFLAVAQGSHQPPKFIELQYHGAGTTPPIVLVGKGVTFDSGGISIKPADGMNEMKYDMAGAASVLGTLKACAELNLPINVVGLIAATENMPGGGAIKPGDIVTSLSGQTIEIINTDAEGRLILADALTYAERFNPQMVIDIATLTGAVIVALGNITTGFMTKDDELAELISRAAKESGDKAWRLPLDEAYQEALESPLADMINSSFNRTAGSITAACFLSRFTEKYRWAHLDIAGTAWVSGKQNHATGRPVPLLIQLIRHVAQTR